MARIFADGNLRLPRRDARAKGLYVFSFYPLQRAGVGPQAFLAGAERCSLATGHDNRADLHAWWTYPLLTLLGGALRGYPEIQDANFRESAVTLLSWNAGRSCDVRLRSIQCMWLMSILAALDSGCRS